METELVEIEPSELRFKFELKKQSSCMVRLSNKSGDCVAFKIKTTSPKRYCVRPNTGVILPQSTCDFIVTMQAQRTAPPDLQLKDKFLIQSTIVPFGVTDEEITSALFTKESGRFVEECKLKVVLVSPSHSPDSPDLLQLNEPLKQEKVDQSPREKPSSALTESPVVKETLSFKDELLDASNTDSCCAMEIESLKLQIAVFESTLSKMQGADVEDLKSKINTLSSKLSEEEKTLKDSSQQEAILLRRRAASKVQAGFPTFFVLFIWIIGIAIGYLMRT